MGERQGRMCVYFFFQAEDGIRDYDVTGVQTCAVFCDDDGKKEEKKDEPEAAEKK